jgi:hypothetical protein
MELSPSTKQHAMAAMTAAKDRAEKALTAANTSINHTALLEMYQAGYARCMVDHHIEIAPPGENTDGA